MYKESAVDYFDRHKSSNECHITSDGRVFHTKGSADGFANGLKDNKVTSYTRSGIELAEIPVTDAKEVTGDNPPVIDANEGKAPKAVIDLKAGKDDNSSAPAKVYTNEDLMSFNFEKPNYIDAKNLAKGLGIESKSQKLPDLVEALLVAKNNLQPQV